MLAHQDQKIDKIAILHAYPMPPKPTRMTRIAFILLCHKDPDAVVAQALRLTAEGDFIAIHFDRRASDDAYAIIEAKLSSNPNVLLAPRRVRCGWGEWSLVEATLLALRAAHKHFTTATHFYLMSGDCMPTKSAKFAHQMLAPSKTDYIESVDFYASDWIKTGMKEERLEFRHWFNERGHKTLFYWSMYAQRRLGLRRAPPDDLKICIGSQWWCLRRETIRKVLEFIDTRPDVTRFFRTTWIPDETFFQTLVRHLVPACEIDSRTLTFLTFTDYGMPATFYNDHYSFLLSQDYLFARKISSEANALKTRLGTVWSSDQDHFEVSNAGRKLHNFLTGRGRIGRRFAPRCWEAESSLGADRELLILCCKKWDVAKRVLGKARNAFQLDGVAYLFHEQNADLPDLGGIDSSVDKRTRHRRAFLRMLFDHHQTDRLAICVDPSAIDVMQDFFSDKARTRMLVIGCIFTDDDLIGHAQRVGLAGDIVTPDTRAQLLPALHQEIALEQDRIRDADFPEVYRVEQTNSEEENTGVLSEFFRIPWEQAREIANPRTLYND